jgi:hypothetical protein
MLDLAALDAAGPHKITTSTSTPTDYTLKPGNLYNLTVTVSGPPSTQPWQSGDWHSNAEIFSGTRISVLYPESLYNAWTTAYSDTATGAQTNAKNILVQQLGLDSTAAANVQTEALFTGDLPNQVPVRLDLWKT